MFVCQFCKKECKSTNSHRNHERCCPKNPNRNYVNGMTGKVSHKRGKTKFTDESILRQSNTFKEKIRNGEYVPVGHPHTQECKERISEIMQTKMHNRFTASKRIEYKGIRFESSWEYKLALDLDANGIDWKRPSPLLYKDNNGQTRRYYPDFYLPDFDVYLDPKNDYVKKLDENKIKLVTQQNNVIVILLSKNQLFWGAVKEFISLR